MNTRLSFRCREKDECIDLAEHLSKIRKGSTPFITLQVKNNSVNITISGSNTEVKLIKENLSRAYKEWKSAIGLNRGFNKVVTLRELMKLAGKPFPVEALVEVLKARGLAIQKEGEKLILPPNARGEEVIDVAIKLSELLQELNKLKPKASHTAKQLIIAYSFLAGLNCEEGLNQLINRKAIKVEGPRATPLGEWRSLLRKLIGENGRDEA
jgi:hypothetical protein